MRLHRLSITAFGPFVETADVDFDALSDAGLFLLSGATGAGKSSVLDAVCFALYGAIPGDRNHAGRLRSDQAPPGLAPSVELDVTLSGRRFRVVRSPAWERPKKRGTGDDARAGQGDGVRAPRRRVVPAQQPARRGGRPAVGSARDEPRPVLPGRAAPPGSLPGLPAGRLRPAPPAPVAPVPDRPLRARRGMAARPPADAAPRHPDPPRPRSPTWSAASPRLLRSRCRRGRRPVGRVGRCLGGVLGARPVLRRHDRAPTPRETRAASTADAARAATDAWEQGRETSRARARVLALGRRPRAAHAAGRRPCGRRGPPRGRAPGGGCPAAGRAGRRARSPARRRQRPRPAPAWPRPRLPGWTADRSPPSWPAWPTRSRPSPCCSPPSSA